jgi:phosphoglycerol transferase MdoB-like AlkP superfamily enzyme
LVDYKILPSNLQTLRFFTPGGTRPLVSEIKNIASLIMARPVIFSFFPQEVVLRHFGLPHHVLAEAMGLLLLANVFLFVKKSL